MKNLLLIVISLVVVAALLLFMGTFTVKFTDVAVVSTFGRADETSVIREPGLRFKWPAPIQSVTVYDRRVRLLQAQLETQQTADERQITVRAFMTWSVEDPLVFYRRFRGTAGADPAEHYKQAEAQLTSQLRSAMSAVSRYRLNDLFAARQGASKLPDLEKDILDRLQQSLEKDANGTQYGVKVNLVGINRIELPEQTSSAVFERMKATRATLAARAQAEGQGIAAQITAQSQAEASKIRSFAELRASSIRATGERDAAEWLAKQKENPELAEFLRKIDFLRDGFTTRTNIILPTNFMGIDLMTPGGLKPLMEQAGLAPPATTPPGTSPAAPAAATPARSDAAPARGGDR
ncbi:MAG: hypothetical protein IBJ11_07155 [Phycisphaerales bacterium]|nr:hypothetical protein [Phycisphaerales bacterium]